MQRRYMPNYIGIVSQVIAFYGPFIPVTLRKHTPTSNYTLRYKQINAKRLQETSLKAGRHTKVL